MVFVGQWISIRNLVPGHSTGFRVCCRLPGAGGEYFLGEYPNLLAVKDVYGAEEQLDDECRDQSDIIQWILPEDIQL